MVLLYSPS